MMQGGRKLRRGEEGNGQNERCIFLNPCMVRTVLFCAVSHICAFFNLTSHIPWITGCSL